MSILYHYGVKGMKWGVRRDRAVLDRLAGRKTTSNAETKAERKAENKKAKKQWKEFKSKTGWLERRGLRKKAIQSRADYIVNDVLNNEDNRLVTITNPNNILASTKIATGKEFADHLKKGGAFDALNTELYNTDQKIPDPTASSNN